MTEQELNKKLAEWVRFKVVSRFGGSLSQATEYLWQYPDGNHYKDLPDFTQSLDACFKWLVPNKSIKTVCLCDHFDYNEGIPERNGYEATVMWDRMDNTVQGIEKNPSLALCKAIEKLIDRR